MAKVMTKERARELLSKTLIYIGDNGNPEGIILMTDIKQMISLKLMPILEQCSDANEYFNTLRSEIGFTDFELAELDDDGYLPVFPLEREDR